VPDNPEVEILDVRSGQAHCQLIFRSSGITVVDTGSDRTARPILEAIARHGHTPADVSLIVLTHGDGDHIAGARAIQDASSAQVLASAEEADYLAGRLPPGFPLAKRLFHIVGRPIRRPVVTIWTGDDGLVLDDIEVVPAPGHTRGSIVVFAGDALCAGDAFTTGDRFTRVPKFMDVDAARAEGTIRDLVARRIVRAFSGHGPPADGAGHRLADLVDRLDARSRL
jgi:glyoxylase-like metal-dependent hydrolase (beta-lactamase superfamily II)